MLSTSILSRPIGPRELLTIFAMVCAATTEVVLETVISCRSCDAKRTILISNILARHSITPEKCTCPRIALEYRHDDSLEMCTMEVSFWRACSLRRNMPNSYFLFYTTNVDSRELWATLSVRQCDADIWYVHFEVVNGRLLWWPFNGVIRVVQLTTKTTFNKALTEQL